MIPRPSASGRIPASATRRQSRALSVAWAAMTQLARRWASGNILSLIPDFEPVRAGTGAKDHPARLCSKELQAQCVRRGFARLGDALEVSRRDVDSGGGVSGNSDVPPERGAVLVPLAGDQAIGRPVRGFDQLEVTHRHGPHEDVSVAGLLGVGP